MSRGAFAVCINSSSISVWLASKATSCMIWCGQGCTSTESRAVRSTVCIIRIRIHHGVRSTATACAHSSSMRHWGALTAAYIVHHGFASWGHISRARRASTSASNKGTELPRVHQQNRWHSRRLLRLCLYIVVFETAGQPESDHLCRHTGNAFPSRIKRCVQQRAHNYPACINRVDGIADDC